MPVFAHFLGGRGGICHLALFPAKHPGSIYSNLSLYQETLVAGEKKKCFTFADLILFPCLLALEDRHRVLDFA